MEYQLSCSFGSFFSSLISNQIEVFERAICALLVINLFGDTTESAFI